MLGSLLRRRGKESEDKMGEIRRLRTERGDEDEEDSDDEEEGVEEVGKLTDSGNDLVSKYQQELAQKEEEIEVLKLQLKDKDDRIAFLLALLHRTHLSETCQEMIRSSTHRNKDIDSFVLNAISYNQNLEEKLTSLKLKNMKLRRKLREQESKSGAKASREEEFKLLKQILSIEEQIDHSQEDEIEYLQSLARKQYEYATAAAAAVRTVGIGAQAAGAMTPTTRTTATTAVSTKESKNNVNVKREYDEEEEVEKGYGSPGKESKAWGASHSCILDEVRNMLDNFGV
jgi:hypothetical protein